MVFLQNDLHTVINGLAGGLGAAIITDLFQGILTIIFSFLLLTSFKQVKKYTKGNTSQILQNFVSLRQLKY